MSQLSIPDNWLCELEIAKILQKKKLNNIIDIYEINENLGYIIWEQLDYKKQKNRSTWEHIYKGLNELHNLNIIYLNFNINNIGYSHKDQSWKLSKFINSGIININKEWIIKPYNLKILPQYEDILNDYDILLYENFIEKQLSKNNRDLSFCNECNII